MNGSNQPSCPRSCENGELGTARVELATAKLATRSAGGCGPRDIPLLVERDQAPLGGDSSGELHVRTKMVPEVLDARLDSSAL
jgi:hypothetical protein